MDISVPGIPIEITRCIYDLLEITGYDVILQEVGIRLTAGMFLMSESFQNIGVLGK